MSLAGPWSSGFSLGFGPQNIIVAGNASTADSMQLLGFSSTEALYYDEANTQDFYLLRKPPLVTPTTLYRVSPNFARNWLVFSGLASNQVYNPFGSNQTQNYSNVV